MSPPAMKFVEERASVTPIIQVIERPRAGWCVVIRYGAEGLLAWQRTAYTREDVALLLDAAAIERLRIMRWQEAGKPLCTSPLYEGLDRLAQADAAKHQGGST